MNSNQKGKLQTPRGKRAIELMAALPIKYTVAEYGSVQACYVAQAHDLQLIFDALEKESHHAEESCQLPSNDSAAAGPGPT